MIHSKCENWIWRKRNIISFSVLEVLFCLLSFASRIRMDFTIQKQTELKFQEGEITAIAILPKRDRKMVLTTIICSVNHRSPYKLGFRTDVRVLFCILLLLLFCKKKIFSLVYFTDFWGPFSHSSLLAAHIFQAMRELYNFVSLRDIRLAFLQLCMHVLQGLLKCMNNLSDCQF